MHLGTCTRLKYVVHKSLLERYARLRLRILLEQVRQDNKTRGAIQVRPVMDLVPTDSCIVRTPTETAAKCGTSSSHVIM